MRCVSLYSSIFLGFGTDLLNKQIFLVIFLIPFIRYFFQIKTYKKKDLIDAIYWYVVFLVNHVKLKARQNRAFILDLAHFHEIPIKHLQQMRPHHQHMDLIISKLKQILRHFQLIADQT